MARATSTTVATNVVSSRRMRLHGATMAMAANVPDGPVTGAATQHTLGVVFATVEPVSKVCRYLLQLGAERSWIW